MPADESQDPNEDLEKEPGEAGPKKRGRKPSASGSAEKWRSPVEKDLDNAAEHADD